MNYLSSNSLQQYEQHSTLNHFFATQQVPMDGTCCALRESIIVTGDHLADGLFCVSADIEGTQHILLGELSYCGSATELLTQYLNHKIGSWLRSGEASSNILDNIAIEIKSLFPSFTNCGLLYCTIDRHAEKLHVVNHGMPPVYVYNNKTNTANYIAAENPPLIAQYGTLLHLDAHGIDFTIDEQMFINSKTLYQNAESAMVLSITNLNKHFATNNDAGDALNQLYAELDAKCKDLPSAILYSSQPCSNDADLTQQMEYNSNLDVDFTLNEDILKCWDPLPVIIEVLMSEQHLIAHRTKIYTVLSELFSNSLDHGLLGLDSELKQCQDSIQKYYAERTARLAQLEGAKIRVEMKTQHNADNITLDLTITDNGQGFDTSNVNTDKSNYSGRGIALIKSLCESVQYATDGKQVVAKMLFPRAN